MIPVLNDVAMREADRITIEELGVSSLVLMEQAAAAVTATMLERYPDCQRVVVLCGPGNNGGDGLAVARQLHVHGVGVEALMMADPDRLSGDAARQLEIAKRFGVRVRCRAEVERLPELHCADVVVDALFGTGLTRPLEGHWAEVVAAVQAVEAPVVAVDIPSGLLAGDAGVPPVAVEANLTVTFGAPKVAHVLPPACWNCGDVAVADIGIPPWVLDDLAVMKILEARDVAGWLPTRLPDAHKGHFGHLLVIAGRFGRAGAAALAARGALAAGSGLVTVATPRSAVNAVQSLVPEAMVDGLAEDGDGVCTGEGILPLLSRATAVAFGPGIGLGEGPKALLTALLESWRGPLLLDADGLTLAAPNIRRLQRTAETVLTPHPGELARLLNCDSTRVVADRVSCALEAVKSSRAVVLAKGARTLIAAPVGLVRVVPTGGPGLATGGSGDVLTGVVGALLAQGLTADEAAAAGAYLHGLAGDLAGKDYSGAVPAGSLIEYLSRAEHQVRQGGG
jgi:ADP-dependent NAD(P)H-hydrate dehydratase / NAD(P)H-hydrate epimerase